MGRSQLTMIGSTFGSTFSYGRASRYLGLGRKFAQLSVSVGMVERPPCWRESGTETLF